MAFNFLGSVAKKMMLDFEDSRIFKHHGVKGAVRENSLITEFLKKYLPKKYDIGSGVIVNANGTQSRQQDIFIYDSFTSPLLYNDEETRYVPVESIYCTIEVKSTLTKEELEKSLKNIQSVKSLVNDPHRPIPTGLVFAYKSNLSLDTLCKHFVEMNKQIPLQHRVNAICVLELGLLVYFNEEGLSEIVTNPRLGCVVGAIKDEPAKNLILFYLLLLTELNSKKILPPDLLHYAERQGILDETNRTLPRQDFSDKAFILHPGTQQRIYLNEAYKAIDEKQKTDLS